ncbi:MAG: sugar-binding domain-containing protein, partial [Candidatus Limnocylindrales bacterium]
MALAREAASPAVVNPPIRSELRKTISLDGDWEFSRDPEAQGEAQRWFAPDAQWPEKLTIKVPGCWEARGIGAPGPSHPVAVEQSIRPLRGTYMGAAWYHKRVTLPADWAGQRIWLKIGGVNSQGWFWINGQSVGHLNAYCGTFKFDVTDLVRAGEPADVVAMVRNDVASGKGLFNWIERFGGLYRSVELEATPDIAI